jgi:hypothetical protein
MGLAVLLGVLAQRILAFIAAPEMDSTTTEISFCPSPLHRARRLKPSITSKVPSPVVATRRGIGARSFWGSLRSPRRGASEVLRLWIGTANTPVTGAAPRD